MRRATRRQISRERNSAECNNQRLPLGRRYHLGDAQRRGSQAARKALQCEGCPGLALTDSFKRKFAKVQPFASAMPRAKSGTIRPTAYLFDHARGHRQGGQGGEGDDQHYELAESNLIGLVGDIAAQSQERYGSDQQ